MNWLRRYYRLLTWRTLDIACAAVVFGLSWLYETPVYAGLYLAVVLVHTWIGIEITCLRDEERDDLIAMQAEYAVWHKASQIVLLSGISEGRKHEVLARFDAELTRH